MTSEEAIEILSGMYLVGTSDKRSRQEYVKKHNDAIDYAKGKLMKKKPAQYGVCHKCPSCKALVYKFQKCCDQCGQAIDWGESVG